MLADWTAACGAEDPVLVVPWSDPETGSQFVNLRQQPLHLTEVFEAELYGGLRRALQALNAPASAFLTAKCDAWTMFRESSAEKLDGLRLELDLDDTEAACATASYIDLLPRERSRFVSSHRGTDLVARIARRASRLPHPQASLELVLRPAVADLNLPLEGYSLTLYVTAVAGDQETACRLWEHALEDVVHLLREREWAVPPGSATID